MEGSQMASKLEHNNKETSIMKSAFSSLIGGGWYCLFEGCPSVVS